MAEKIKKVKQPGIFSKLLKPFKSEKSLGMSPPKDPEKLKEYNEIMSDFNKIEKEVIQANGNKDPYKVIWELAKHKRGESDAREYPVEDTTPEPIVDKQLVGREGIPSGTSIEPEQTIPELGTDIPSPKRGIFSRFGRNKSKGKGVSDY